MMPQPLLPAGESSRVREAQARGIRFGIDPMGRDGRAEANGQPAIAFAHPCWKA